jgi:hypothetical protein
MVRQKAVAGTGLDTEVAVVFVGRLNPVQV